MSNTGLPVLYFIAISVVISHLKLMDINQILPQTCIHTPSLTYSPALYGVNPIYVSGCVAPGQAKQPIMDSSEWVHWQEVGFEFYCTCAHTSVYV